MPDTCRIAYLLRGSRKPKKTGKQNNSVDNLKESHLLKLSAEIYEELFEAFFKYAQKITWFVFYELNFCFLTVVIYDYYFFSFIFNNLFDFAV